MPREESLLQYYHAFAAAKRQPTPLLGPTPLGFLHSCHQSSPDGVWRPPCLASCAMLWQFWQCFGNSGNVLALFTSTGTPPKRRGRRKRGFPLRPPSSPQREGGEKGKLSVGKQKCLYIFFFIVFCAEPNCDALGWGRPSGRNM